MSKALVVIAVVLFIFAGLSMCVPRKQRTWRVITPTHEYLTNEQPWVGRGNITLTTLEGERITIGGDYTYQEVTR